MQLDEQRLRFRDAMASLSAAVNIITTEGDAGQCGITATAVCSVTDTPPSLMVCINANSAMNPVFQGNGKLCVNVLNHEQELMARHFAGMTGMAMEERFSLSCWQKGPLAQPVLKKVRWPVLKVRSAMCRQLAHIWCIWWRLKTSSSVQKVTDLSTLNAVSIR